jgi:hypothetical protein
LIFGVYEEPAINGKEGGILENKKQHPKALETYFILA